MLPRLQGENWVSVSEAVGLMMNREVALHEVVLKGQQAPDVVQPSAHFERSAPESLGEKSWKAYIVLGSRSLTTNRPLLRKMITYNRTKIVTNLMSDDLPFSPSSG
jgi:hypothetical protein